MLATTKLRGQEYHGTLKDTKKSSSSLNMQWDNQLGLVSKVTISCTWKQMALMAF